MLSRPVQEQVYRVPPTSIYENNRIYLLRDGRLAGIEVNIVGSTSQSGEYFRLVRSDQVSDGDKLVMTRLPNATTGLKVKPVGQGPDGAGDGKMAGKGKPGDGARSADAKAGPENGKALPKDPEKES